VSARTAEAASIAAVEESPTSTARLRVLVADDNHDSAELSASLLELWGHDAYTGHTGREALELAARHHPHVSLLDIGMPDLNGYEVAAEIRKVPWGKQMLLIAITGWGREEDKKRALSAGFDYHLTKPIDPRKLRALLSSLEPPRAEASR
jgi:CheY-like chemotaxis protein